MDPGDYRTNVLSFSNYTSIDYEYLEYSYEPVLGTARKLLHRTETAWRQDGKLVHCDTLRDGIWAFRNGNHLSDLNNTQSDIGIVTRNGVVEVQGIHFVVKQSGTFEPASLVRSKQATSAVSNMASSLSSPSSSLENTTRNAQFQNSRSVQANASYSPIQESVFQSPGQKPTSRSEDSWPPIEDIHQNFISAVLGSIVYLLCRDEGFIPLNSRTLILGSLKSTSPGGPVKPASNFLHIANAITLATLDISLTSLGTLVIKARSDTASGSQNLVDGFGALSQPNKLIPGTALWLAPGGNAAKFHGSHDEKATQTSIQHSASALDSRPGSLNSTAIKAWQSKCLEWLSAKGIDTMSIESDGWLFVQVLEGNTLYLNIENQGIPILEGRTIVPWPARLCFQTSSSGTRALPANDTPVPGSRDPLAFAEEWYIKKDERETIILNRQKERQVADAQFKKQADVEARALQSHTYSSAMLRRGSNVGAMYPTPPDAIHHPIGATPSFDGAGSTPGNLNPFMPQDGSMPVTTSGLSENDVDMWATPAKKGRNPHFNDNDHNNDLFDGLGGDLFGNEVTDADFSFFDEADEAQLELPRILAESTDPIFEPHAHHGTKSNGMHAPDIIMHGQKVENENQLGQNIGPSQAETIRNDSKTQTLQKSHAPRVFKQPLKARINPPFDQELVFQRLTRASRGSNMKVPTRRVSLFNKIEFENSLASVDQKYGANGQFKFSTDTKRLKRVDTSQIPQTKYLSTRRKQQTKGLEPIDIARILNEESLFDQPEVEEPMEFLIEPSNTSQISDQDDTSQNGDDNSLIPKIGLERNWLAENAQDDVTPTQFNPLSMDFKQPVDTPQSAGPPHIPSLDADPADWSLTTYFTSPEPETQSIILTDLERIATAQILADQAVSGTLQLPRIPGSESPQAAKATTTRELVRSLARAAKTILTDVTVCTMRTYLEIQGIPALNQGLRLPPRPINPPRMINHVDNAKPNNLFIIPPPQLEVRRSDSKLSVLPAAVSFWENLGLGPAKSNKNINAVCVFPNMEGLSTNANYFLEQMRSVYESYRLGNHERVSSNDFENGLLSFPLDSNQQDASRNLATLQETAARLSRALSSTMVEETNFVVYFVYPVNNPTLLVHICSSFQHLFQLYRKALNDKKIKASNDLVLQLIPIDFIASTSTIPVPLPSEYARLALEVYDRCVDFTSSSSSPAIMLEQPLPRIIEFKLDPTPSASLLQENTCLHIAYAQSIDDRWITAVWTDNKGTQQMTASYCLGRKNEPISMPFSEVAHEIWETTLDFISSKKIHWRIMIARVGIMDPSEAGFWTGLAAVESDAQINLTLITVQTDPSLRLLPPAITLTANNNVAQAVTPVSTPQNPPIVSPDTSTTPVRESTNAPTPGDASQEPDVNARLLDLTDQSWGCVLSHRLNNSNSLLELNPALISGYLIKRGGMHSDDPPVAIEVNVIHSEMVGNPRTFHENLLREILGYYRGLATLARARGMVDPVIDGRPWHIAAAEKAVKALHLLM